MILNQQIELATRKIRDKFLMDSWQAHLESRILMSHVLNQQISWIVAHPEITLSTLQTESFHKLVERRLTGEPIAYITGKREFYNIELAVSASVLIPRPETETLVETALFHLSEDQPLKILDLGTGSGAIALSLAKLRPKWKITATDISEQALTLAQYNAQRLGLDQVKFIKTDWFNGLNEERFDCILSNPPYIASDDPHLFQLNFEPSLALISGKDGLNALRILITHARNHLHEGGLLACEHGFNQAEACHNLFHTNGFSDIICIKDLAGLDRITWGRVIAFQNS